MRNIKICEKCERFECKRIWIRCSIVSTCKFAAYQEEFMFPSKFKRQALFEKCLFYVEQINAAGNIEPII